MRSSEKQLLLKEIVANPEYQSFRAQCFRAGMSEFRASHPRAFPLVRMSIAAALALLFGFLFSGRKPSGPAPEAPVFDTIVSAPLNPADLVRTHLDPTLLVRTESSKAALQIVESSTATLPLTIDDRGLFVVLGKRPVAIVRHGHSSEVLILNN